jgi:hypothetical protein
MDSNASTSAALDCVAAALTRHERGVVGSSVVSQFGCNSRRPSGFGSCCWTLSRKFQLDATIR